MDLYNLAGKGLRLEFETEKGCPRNLSVPVIALQRIGDIKDNTKFIYELMSYPTTVILKDGMQYQAVALTGEFSQGSKEVNWYADVNCFCHLDSSSRKERWRISEVMDKK